eukprot:Phypoly_transcript_04385.p1 GENE.Phypoly_transcript_04385~~Phypoly_transcript_04385.p1  ORF type:complete len:374 (-),score=37.57 Phypoly_transcript_04385:2-1123(-)
MNICMRVLAIYGACVFLVIMFLWNYAYFCGWHFTDSKTRFLLIGDPQIQGDSRIENSGFYGQVDVWYNDLYFRHIVDNLLYHLQPSHVFVLGDLFSSQYISDEEFDHRVERYFWIFKNVKVPFYNIVGNHDIGYGGDITHHKIARFEAAFGKVNDILIIENHLIGIVNSMNLDHSRYEEAMDEAWDNLENLREIAQNTSLPVIIMKHIPLLKEEFNFSTPHFSNLFTKERKRELCAERAATEFDYHGNVRWQNMMSANATQYILEEIQPIFVFNGHDHDGCIYRHNEQTVEYTLRSIMGDFGGYVALFEILPLPEPEKGEVPTYEYFYTPCPFVHLSVVTITSISTLIWILIMTFLVCLRVLQPVSLNKTKVS